MSLHSKRFITLNVTEIGNRVEILEINFLLAFMSIGQYDKDGLFQGQNDIASDTYSNIESFRKNTEFKKKLFIYKQ